MTRQPSHTSPVTIRPAAPADFPAIGRLGALLVRVHHDFDPLRFIAASAQTETGYGDYLRSQSGKANVDLLVAARDADILGYAWGAVEGFDYMSLRGPAAVLYDIVVDTHQRGSGVGSQLLRAMLAAFEARGAPRVVLSTAARNEAAQRLFARMGFRETMIEMTRELERGLT